MRMEIQVNKIESLEKQFALLDNSFQQQLIQ